MDDSLPAPHEASDSFDSNMRSFGRLVLRYIRVFSACLVVAVCLAIIAYLRTTPKFSASGSVMVQHSSLQSDSLESPMDRELMGYSQLFTSDAVVTAALERLSELPPELNPTDGKEYIPAKLASILRVYPRSKSNIIDLTCTSASPEACVEVINAVVDAALVVFGETQKNHAFDLVKSLDEERRDVRDRLTARELALLEAKRLSGDIGLKDKDAKSLHPLISRALTISNSLIETQQSRVEQQTLLEQINHTISEEGDLLQHMVSFEQLMGKLFEVSPLAYAKQESQELAAVQEELRVKQRLLDETNRFFGPAHPRHAAAVNEFRDVQARLHEIQNSINHGIHDSELGERLIEILESSITNAVKKEKVLDEQYQFARQQALKLNDNLAHVAMIEREVELLRQQHQSLQNRIADVDLNLDRASIQFLVVSDPTVPMSPTGPSLVRFLVVGVLIGSAVALVISWSVDQLNGKFDSVEALQQDLGQPPVAVVGEIPAARKPGLQGVHLLENPSTNQSESIRTLRASLGFARNETTCLAVTSSEPGDGKTTVISNLAVSFAQSKARCLIIDADVRKPGLSKLFGVRGKPGLSDVLRSDGNVPELMQDNVLSSELENLDYLPCGMKTLDPTAILASSRMEEIVGWAMNHYDQVLVDCPPALIASDAVIVGRVVDSMLVVIRPQKNQRKLTQRTLALLKTSGVEVAGYVLNGTSAAFDKSLYGYGYGAAYGYGEQEEAEENLIAMPDPFKSSTSTRKAA